LIKDSEHFKKVRTEYELGENFEINNLCNLVPTHGKCNRRKSDELFSKQATLFYLALTNKTKTKIENEIKKLRKRKNKGQIISKLQSALAANLIETKELQEVLKKAQENDWSNTKIKLPLGVQFVDEVYDLFYLNTDISILYDKKMLVGSEDDWLELSNDKNEILKVSTLREWQHARRKGYYPLTNYAIKLASSFTFLEEFFAALGKAKMPRVSFVSEPWIEIDNLDYLSPNILYDPDGGLVQYTEKGLSVGDLVRQKITSKNSSSPYKISLEFRGMEISLIEQFRADFNNDGIEDIFVRGWMRAVGGTMGFGFTSTLTRFSNKHLVDKAK
jgi:hypothetical protein